VVLNYYVNVECRETDILFLQKSSKVKYMGEKHKAFFKINLRILYSVNFVSVRKIKPNGQI
jgi:hypothetical protein